QVDAELAVDANQIIRELEAQAESVRDFATRIAEHWKAQMQRVSRFAIGGGRLRRDGDKRCAHFADVAGSGVRRFEVNVAEGAPHAAIEGDHKGPVVEQGA